MSSPPRRLYPSSLPQDLADVRRRLLSLETNMGRPFSIGSINGPVQNQSVPPVGNFDGVTKYDVATVLPCTFRLRAPTRILVASWASGKLTAPGGGQFGYWSTAISLAPWDRAHVLVESPEILMDSNLNAYVTVRRYFDPMAGNNLTPPIVLGAGTYEARQRVHGDAGTNFALYDGLIQVFSTGG